MNRKIRKAVFPALLFLGALFFIYCAIGAAPPLGKMSAGMEPDAGLHEIGKGEEIEQSFRWDRERLAGVCLMLAAEEGGIADAAQVSLFRGDTLLQTWRIDKYSVGNVWTKFLLDEPIADAAGEYTIRIFADKQMELALGMTSEHSGESAGWTSGGTENPGQYLCWRGVERDFSKTAVFLFAAAALGAVLGILLLLGKKGVRQEWMFLAVYVFMGIFCLAALPESRTPDEFSHFARSYEIAQGRLLSQKNPDGGFGIEQAGGTLPGNLEAGGALFTGDTTLYDIAGSLDERIDEENPEFYGYANTALYAPTSYLFQAAGIRAASLFTDRVVLILYAGRLFNWAAIGILLFFCIRYLPAGKTALALLSLLPMNIQQFNSLSADGFAFAAAAAFVTCILCLRRQENGRIRRSQAALLYVLTALLCLCKIVYAPLCLLLFLLPRERFGSRKGYALHVAGLGLTSIVSTFGWLAAASGFLIEFQPGVKSGEQIVYILSHPLQYLETLFQTLNGSFLGYVLGLAGENLGALDIALGELLPLFCLAVLALSCGYESAREVPEKRVRYAFLAVSGLVVLLTFTSLYIQWTPYRFAVIRGVQGRYFLPVLLPLLLGIGSLRRRLAFSNACLATAAADVCAFAAVMAHML